MVAPKNGLYLTLDDIKPKIIPQSNIHHTPTRVVSLENTLSGVILPLGEAQAISSFVKSLPAPNGQPPIAMHLDGARVFDAIVAEGVDLKAYAACFDSVSICLSKGLGAPMGSILVESKDFVNKARVYRKMLGGGVRQPGILAAAALSALDYTLPRLSSVHSLAKTTAEKLQSIGYKLLLPVQTNMIILDLPSLGITSASFLLYCAKENVRVFPSGRLVFHHQTATEGIEDLIRALTKLMADHKNGNIQESENGVVNGQGHC